MKTIQCLYCRNNLVGRSDKKFCDAQCRSSYHNQHKAKHEIVIARTNSELRKNRSILAHFCPSGKATVRKEVLATLEYNFKYYTHTYAVQNGLYYFCYDYGYRPIKERGIDKMLIVQQQKYTMEHDFDPWSS